MTKLKSKSKNRRRKKRQWRENNKVKREGNNDK